MPGNSKATFGEALAAGVARDALRGQLREARGGDRGVGGVLPEPGESYQRSRHRRGAGGGVRLHQVGPDRFSLPHHRMPVDSRSEGLVPA